MVGSNPPAIVFTEPQTMEMRHTSPDMIENNFRFELVLKILHENESALLVRTKSPKNLENSTVKRLYALIPCIDEGLCGDSCGISQ